MKILKGIKMKNNIINIYLCDKNIDSYFDIDKLK